MIDNGLLSRLEGFITSDLASQLPVPADDIQGTFTPCFDEERYCGPNSAVKDAYRLELSFQAGVEIIGTFKDDISYDTVSQTFGSRRRHRRLLVITRASRDAQKALSEAVDALLMNQTIEEQLAELSYLWTSGEWGLHRIHRSCAQITLVFPAGRPSLRELLAVRALVPRFAQSSMSLLKAEVENVPEFVVGEFGNLEARRLESEALALGLEVRREDTSSTSYLPTHVDGHVLLIKNHELTTLVTEEMLRRGVKIVADQEHD